MMFLALALLAAAVAEGATTLLPRKWGVKLDTPVEDARTGRAVRVVDGRVVEVDEDEPEVSERRKRIVYGQVATPHEYKSMGLLQWRYGNYWYPLCGGFVYNERTVITAGHCVDWLRITEKWNSLPDEVVTAPSLNCFKNRLDYFWRSHNSSELRVVAGDHNIYLAEGTEQVRPVESILVHPDFSYNFDKGFPNDIAVLKLISPLTFNDYVQPVELAEDEEDEEGIAQKVGWGELEDGTYPSTLHHVNIPILTTSECNQLWDDRIQETHICFNDPNSLVGTCYGDSGGPAYSNGKAIGVTSWGPDNCTSTHHPSVDTRVSKFIDWIEDNAADTA